MDIIAYGNIRPVDEKHPSVFAYEREYNGEKLLVVCNFYRDEVSWNSGIDLNEYKKVIGNYTENQIESGTIKLRPFEAIVLWKEKLSQ